MAGASLLTLLDDIALLMDDVAANTKVAASKTAAVLGDDLAVNAEQLSGGIKPDRELAVVFAVFKGSLVNKAIIVPIALLLSFFAPFLIVPLLMLGGSFLCYEGVEKIWHSYSHKKHTHADILVENKDLVITEKDKIKSAILTDTILSAEVVIIALGTMQDQSISSQILSLSLVSILMTVFVYGFVGLLVKLDDIGLHLISKKSVSAFDRVTYKIGQSLLYIAPKIMKSLAFIGTAAMLLVGAGILIHGFHFLEDLSKVMLSYGSSIPTGEFFIGILYNLLVGFIAGTLLVSMVTFFKRVFKK